MYVAKKACRVIPVPKIYLITANIGDLIFPEGAVSSEYVHAYSAEEPCFQKNIDFLLLITHQDLHYEDSQGKMFSKVSMYTFPVP